MRAIDQLSNLQKDHIVQWCLAQRVPHTTINSHNDGFFWKICRLTQRCFLWGIFAQRFWDHALQNDCILGPLFHLTMFSKKSGKGGCLAMLICSSNCLYPGCIAPVQGRDKKPSPCILGLLSHMQFKGWLCLFALSCGCFLCWRTFKGKLAFLLLGGWWVLQCICTVLYCKTLMIFARGNLGLSGFGYGGFFIGEIAGAFWLGVSVDLCGIWMPKFKLDFNFFSCMLLIGWGGYALCVWNSARKWLLFSCGHACLWDLDAQVQTWF